MRKYFIGGMITLAMMFFLSFFPQLALAIGGSCEDGFGNPIPCVDPDTPVDGGIYILLAAGLVYGVKKIWESSQKEGIQKL